MALKVGLFVYSPLAGSGSAWRALRRLYGAIRRKKEVNDRLLQEVTRVGFNPLLLTSGPTANLHQITVCIFKTYHLD